MNEDDIKIEMRLFALESLFCQIVASIFEQQPRAIFDAVKTQALAGSDKPIFAAVGDPVTSDLLSGEFHEALKRLYEMIQHHLDNNQKHRTK
jgi:hypothetical protein